MCGRFTRTMPVETIAQFFEVTEIDPSIESVEPSYNIAPTQNVAAIVRDDERRLVAMRWGLIPSWAKDESMGAKLINARAETVAEKPSFRTPFKRSRCLIPVDGFYEWKKVGTAKQPFYIRMISTEPFVFAGLCDHWESPEGKHITSCTIITTEPNQLMESIHNRMPVILDKAERDFWLEAGENEKEALRQMLKPYPADLMEAYAVSKAVNSPRNNLPACIAPASEMKER